MRVAPKITLSGEQRAQLDAFARSRSLHLRLVQRAQIVLLASDGKQDLEIAETLNITRQTAGRWRKRFVRLGIPGIEKDAPRPGRTKKVSVSKTQMIVRKTTQERPANSTHWSTRTMAAAVGLSPSTIGRIWKIHGLKPHRIKTFKLSNDKHFIEKLNDIVGLYLSPPEHAIVLSCDEKSQIQALDRTQPGLPLKKGRCGTMTHDYKRNGTTTLFAALNTLNGKVIGTCMQRHRHQEWIKFLRLIDQGTPPDKHVHLIVDNYSTHKHPKVGPEFGSPSSVYRSLHPDQRLLAQYGRTFLPGPDRQAYPPRCLSERQGAHRGHRGLHRQTQSATQAVHLDRRSIRHSRKSHPGTETPE